MFYKANKLGKKPSDHEKNIDFAFHEFGFWGINQYRIMLFFWVFELVFIPKLLADALHANNASWMHSSINIITGSWTMSGKTPSLDYVGCYIIVSALSHPYFIIQLLKKATFLEFHISRAMMDFKSIVFALFIALLSSRLVDLMLDIVDLYFGMNAVGSITIK